MILKIVLTTIFILIPTSNQYQYKCYDSIPDYSYCDSNNDCKLCENKQCYSCLSDLNSCTQCNKDLYLFNKQCYNDQPKGTYCDPQTKICSKCKVDNCDDCKEEINQCKLCNNNSQYPYLYQNQCLDIKPDYVDCNANKICALKPPSYCTPNCQSCIYQSKICQSCSNGFTRYIKIPPSMPTCESSQPSYSSLHGNEYFECPLHCIECNTNFECTKCQNPYFLLNYMCQICGSKGYGPNTQTQICEQCQISNCQDCIQDSQICNKCSNEFYLYQNSCNSNPPTSHYCNQQKVCITCKSGCKTCDQYGNCNDCSLECIQCEDQNNCTICAKDLYLQNKECICKEGYYDISFKKCLLCETLPSKDDCNKQDKSQCYFSEEENKCIDLKNKILFCNNQQKCSLIKPDSSFCINDSSNLSPINKQICEKCHETCKECSGSTSNSCTSCKEGDVLKDSTCEKENLYSSVIYTPQKVKQITQQTEITTQTTVGSTVAFNVAQNAISSSSFGILTTGLSCQKISYLILVNINLPKQIYEPLLKIKGKFLFMVNMLINFFLLNIIDQIPSQQFKSLNFLKLFLDQSDINYPTIKFESVNLSYHILNTCGSAVSLFLICLTLFVLFFLLSEKVKDEKIKLYSQKCYNSIFSTFIIQYFQLSMVIFVIGVNTQIKYFIDSSNYDQLGIKIPFLVTLFIISIILFQQQYQYLNRDKHIIQVPDFYEITRQKILNETIFESKFRRNFILIYLFIESVLIPTFFIQLSNYWRTLIIIAIITQVIQIILIIYLMPFLSKLTNFYFILSGVLWLALYIQYFLLSHYSTQSDINSEATTLDNISQGFLVNVQLLLLINPAYMILSLLIKLIEIIQEKLKERQKKEQILNSSNLQSNLFNSVLENQKSNQNQNKSVFSFEQSFQNQFNMMVSQKNWLRNSKK